MNPILFIPLLLASLGIAIASFLKNKNWLIIAFIVWLVVFTLTILINLIK